MGDVSIEEINQLFLKTQNHLKNGHLKEATGPLLKIITQKNNDKQALKFLSEITELIGDLGFAEDVFQKLADICPENPDVLNKLADILNKRSKYCEAQVYLKKILNQNPKSLDTLIALGNNFSNLKMYKEAADYFRKAVFLKPDDFVILFNLGSTLLNDGQYDEAAKIFEKTITLNQTYAPLFARVGIAYKGQGKIKKAIDYYNRSLDLESDPEVHRNKAIALLTMGNLPSGFQEFEWRKKIKERQGVYEWCADSKPYWQGEVFAGKCLLVHHEEGLGDSIHFSRYLEKVKERGGTVIFSAPKPLLTLYQRIPAIDILLEYSSQNKVDVPFDLVIPLMSLPYIFATTMETIPNKTPYLTADAGLSEKWRQKIKKTSTGGNLKVGIVWAGSTLFKRDFIRSCTLLAMAPLADVPGIDYYSIQIGPAAKETQNPPGKMRLFDLTEHVNDFDDTAALIDNLDLVISVDTAAAHLAGAMGKPVWTLLYYANDWRWFIGRQDSPWYPSMRLFRQESPGDWEGIISKVSDSLRIFQKETNKI